MTTGRINQVTIFRRQETAIRGIVSHRKCNRYWVGAYASARGVPLSQVSARPAQRPRQGRGRRARQSDFPLVIPQGTVRTLGNLQRVCGQQCA